MSRKLKLAVAQCRTLDTTAETLNELAQIAKRAAQQDVDLILFPEAYLGGYPRTCAFGGTVGGRDPSGREQFLQYFKSAVDLGDTPQGADDDWVDRKLSVAKGSKHRGDGTREEIERIARENGIFIATGLVEKAGGSLYCSVVYVDPHYGCIGKRRKVMPTGTERLIWAQGSPRSLRAVTTTIRGVKLTLAAAICWENFMPLLRQSLYSQNVNLYLAPTADGRDTWLPLMRTVGFEGRTFVLTANQCCRKKHLPGWIRQSQVTQRRRPEEQAATRPTPFSKRRTSTITRTEDGHELCLPSSMTQANGDQSHVRPGSSNSSVSPSRRRLSMIPTGESGHQICLPVPDESVEVDTNGTLADSGIRAIDGEEPPKEIPLQGAELKDDSYDDDEEFLTRGGSCIVSPLGEVLAGPLWESEDAELLTADCDFDDCERGRLDLDVGGSYSRSDAFKLTVEGLDLNPPP